MTVITDYIITGIAYPHVKAGRNATTLITTDRYNPREFFYDPAVVISEADLREWRTGKTYELRINHKNDTAVGTVEAFWISQPSESTGVCPLKIVARIPKATGEKVIKDIRDKRLNGFSLGYTNIFSNDGKHVVGKRLREISLVFRPFFPGCDIHSQVVEASADGKRDITKPEYLSDGSEGTFIYCPIHSEMADQPQDANSGAAQKSPVRNQADAPAAGAGAASPQDDILAELQRAKEETANLRKLHEQRETRLAHLEKKEQQELENYRTQQMPVFEKWVAHLKENGMELQPKVAEDYRAIFCSPETKDHASVIMKQHEAALNEKKARAELEEKLAAAQKDRDEWTRRATAALGNTGRKNLASAMGAPDLTMDADPRRRELPVGEVNAGSESADAKVVSRNPLLDMMRPMPTPSKLEERLLRDCGYRVPSDSADVNASDDSRYGQGVRKPMPTSYNGALPDAGFITDKHGMSMTPYSDRYEGGVLLSFLTQNTERLRAASQVLGLKVTSNIVHDAPLTRNTSLVAE